MSEAVILAAFSILSTILTNVVFTALKDRREIARKAKENKLDIEKQNETARIAREAAAEEARMAREAAREAAEDAAIKTFVQLGLQDLQHARSKEAAQAEREKVLVQQINSANERITEQERRISRLENTIADLQQKNNTQEAIIATQANENKRQAQQINDLVREKSRLIEEREALKRQLADLTGKQ